MKIEYSKYTDSLVPVIVQDTNTNKVLMLGGMMELSTESIQEHKNIAALIDQYKWRAVVLVGGYGSLGIQTIKNIFTTFPGLYKNLVIASVGVIDSGVDARRERSINVESIKKVVIL